MAEITSFIDWYKSYENGKMIFDSFMLFLPEEISKDKEKKALLKEMQLIIPLIQNKIAKNDIDKFTSVAKIFKANPDFWFALRFVWNIAIISENQRKEENAKKAGKLSGKRRLEKQVEICEQLLQPLAKALKELKLAPQKGNFKKIVDAVVEEYFDLITDVMKKNSRRTDAKSFFRYYLNTVISFQEQHQVEDNPYRVFRRKRNTRKKNIDK